jgi:hypothetical protein
MRGAMFAAFVVSAGVMGCATLGGAAGPAGPAGPAGTGTAAAAPASKAAPPAPAKPELEVFGRGPPQMGGLKPQDEGTEFIIYHGETYRCTKVKRSAKHPQGVDNCRMVQNEGRNSDPGRATRASVGSSPFK